MEAVDCPNLNRVKGQWYTAVPPLCRCRTGLTPADYFGRALIANLPADVKIGVINVAVGGCKIQLFDKENYKWMLIGLVVIGIGFIVMGGGKSSNPNVFQDKDVYSFTRITVAPILIIAGFIIEIFAIMRRPEGKEVA